MSLLVEQSHAGITLQDSGRLAVAGFGVTGGGAADLTMARLCNVLAGNDPATLLPLLEIPLGGLTVRATTEMVIAFTGIGFNASLNGRPLEAWQSVQLRAGDRFSSGFSRRGARAYLAVQGGFIAEPVLGSVSTVLREQLGGFDGRAGVLQSGQLLPQAPSRRFRAVSVPYLAQQRLPALLKLPFVAGAQWDWFSNQPAFTDTAGQHTDAASFAAQQLCSRLFQLSAKSDRMGQRLTGTALASQSLPLYSEGLVAGAIQLPPDGLPLLMSADHQTIGGYPKLGALTRRSIELVAQALPGQYLQFQLVCATQAIASERARQQRLNQQLQEYWQQWQRY